MRRTLTALGVGLSLLGSTAISTPAQAEGEITVAPLAATASTAQEVARFWLADGAANLKNATPYAVQTEVQGERVSTPVTPDTKPGSVAPVAGPAEPKGKTPTSTGKVFFIGGDGQPHWCSGTALQSQYRNLVATAGHCVYDLQRSDTTLDKWVFVPGYTSGTTPWGLYVGKQSFAHYDFSTYKDYDRDFAFVNVYNGVVSPSPDTLTNTGRLVDNVGGQGFAWNQPTDSMADVFGYPAGPNPDGRRPYTGESLEWSTGPISTMTLSGLPDDLFIGVESPFTGEGSLGSSWLSKYSSDSRAGYLNGITISVADTDGDQRYDTGVSPYFDGAVNIIYRAAATSWTGSIV